jgi:hypothetical protein
MRVGAEHLKLRTVVPLLIFTTIVFTAFPRVGEPHSLSWTKLLGSTTTDRGWDLAVDGAGNAYVTGFTDGKLDGITNAGGDDVFVVKYDTNGDKKWTKLLGTPEHEVGRGIAVDSSGNAYVTGYTSGDFDGNTNVGGTDMFVVKYDTNGQKQWTKLLGTDSPSIYRSVMATGIAVDSGGNAYVTGYTSGNLDGNTNAGRDDIFVVKYDTNGQKQWTKLLGSSQAEHGISIAVDSVGNAYVTGWTAGGLDGNRNAGLFDVFVIKYDTSGDKKWTEQLGSREFDFGSSIAVDTGGNAYVTGSTHGDLDGNTNVGVSDIYVVKYDTNGQKQWTKLLGSRLSDGALGIAMDSDANAYVTGCTDYRLDDNSNAGGDDIFVVKYDTSGDKKWTKLLGTPQDERGTDIAVDSGGNAYVTGWTSGKLDGNIHAGDHDIFVVKYSRGWLRQDSGTSEILYDVWGLGPTDVFAVGDNGTILHYNGSTWTPQTSGTLNSLQGVWGSGPTDVFAVGSNGTILHYGGTTWTPQNSGTVASLWSVWGSGPADVFAVGGGGTILHYDGSSWSPLSIPGAGQLLGVWGTSPMNVFTVGDSGTKDLVVGGTTYPIPTNSVFHSTDGGVTWTSQIEAWYDWLLAISGSGPSDAFAVGGNFTNGSCQGVVYSFDGNNWTKHYTGTPEWKAVYDVWAVNSTEVFAVGIDGTIMHYDGSDWNKEESGTDKHLWGVWGSSPSDMFAVGADGTILHR